MRALHIFSLLLVILVALVGVFIALRYVEPGEDDGSNVTMVEGNGVTRWEVNGIIFHLPREASSASEIVSRTSGGGGVISFQSQAVSIEIRDGQLQVDGRKYGSVVTGDEVDLRGEGKVLVNGKERASEE